MKPLTCISMAAIALVFLSCDPDIVGEGISLPDMNFRISVLPDTGYIKVGDTINLKTALSNQYAGDNITLVDGKPVVKVFITYYSNRIYPIQNNDSFELASNENHYSVSINSGEVSFNSDSNLYLNGIVPVLIKDSFKFDGNLVFKKVGLYAIGLYPSFYEGSKGKARTLGTFNVLNPHWDFYDFPNQPNPSPNDELYYTGYFVAVTE